MLRLAQELVADPEKLVRAVERDRGLMETFLDFVRGLKNRIAIRLSGSERAMLDEAERTLVNLLRGEAGSVAGEKYSFVRATDAEQIARAQELEAQGENAKTIPCVLQETLCISKTSCSCCCLWDSKARMS